MTAGSSAVMALAMMGVMMVPGALPRLASAWRAGRRGEAPESLVAVAALGPFAVWAPAALALNALAPRLSGWLVGALGPAMLAPALLLACVAYQCAPVLRRAICACQAEVTAWPGSPSRCHGGTWGPFRASLRYGIASLACCGPLMVVLTALGLDGFALMALAGAFSAAQAHRRCGTVVRRAGTAAMLAAAIAAL